MGTGKDVTDERSDRDARQFASEPGLGQRDELADSSVDTRIFIWAIVIPVELAVGLS